MKIYFRGPTRGKGFYLIPTIQMWNTNFKEIDGPNTYAVVIHCFFWFTGITIYKGEWLNK